MDLIVVHGRRRIDSSLWRRPRHWLWSQLWRWRQRMQRRCHRQRRKHWRQLQGAAVIKVGIFCVKTTIMRTGQLAVVPRSSGERQAGQNTTSPEAVAVAMLSCTAVASALPIADDWPGQQASAALAKAAAEAEAKALAMAEAASGDGGSNRAGRSV